MRKILLLTISVLVALVIGTVFIYPHNKTQQTVRLYAGAGLRPAVEKLITAFESKTGIRVEADYGGSGVILSRAREDNSADLFMPGDAYYVSRLQELAGSVAQQETIGVFIPVIVVAKGNPKGIHSLNDLARADVKLGLGNAKANQVGRVSADMLKKAGIIIDSTKVQQAMTVNELGVWVKMNAVDAAIVWDAIAANMASDIDQIPIPQDQIIISEVVIARLKQSHAPKAAQKFLEFVNEPEGQDVLKKAGYRVGRN